METSNLMSLLRGTRLDGTPTQAIMAQAANEIERLTKGAEVNSEVSRRTIFELANERDRLRAALERVADEEHGADAQEIAKAALAHETGQNS